jgi:hypothetical protein
LTARLFPAARCIASHDFFVFRIDSFFSHLPFTRWPAPLATPPAAATFSFGLLAVFLFRS